MQTKIETPEKRCANCLNNPCKRDIFWNCLTNYKFFTNKDVDIIHHQYNVKQVNKKII